MNDAGEGEGDPAKLHAELLARVPPEYFDYVHQILADHGIPELPPGEFHNGMMVRSTSATARLHVEEALQHDGVKVIANALGAPPRDLTEKIHGSGRLVAGMCGSVEHARRHAAAGVDVIVAQGTEGGGHTGYIGSIVLWPQVVEAVAPLPVLAAGGIATGAQIAAALVMGAQGAWTGSLWLTTDYSEMTEPQRELLVEARSEDAVITRSLTGKHARMLRTGWTEAWERPDGLQPLPLPLQDLVTGEAVTRLTRYPEHSKPISIIPVGQVVGQLNSVRKTTNTVTELVEEYVDAIDRLNAINAAAQQAPALPRDEVGAR
jgi:NAD(P)H-dependent flavin oxidoreductase YrpB (nitropropane dioxygenase family)